MILSIPYANSPTDNLDNEWAMKNVVIAQRQRFAYLDQSRFLRRSHQSSLRHLDKQTYQIKLNLFYCKACARSSPQQELPILNSKVSSKWFTWKKRINLPYAKLDITSFTISHYSIVDHSRIGIITFERERVNPESAKVFFKKCKRFSDRQLTYWYLLVKS